MKRLTVGAHPDDIDVLEGFMLDDSLALIAADGEAGIDMTQSCSCPGSTRTAATPGITA